MKAFKFKNKQMIDAKILEIFKINSSAKKQRTRETELANSSKKKTVPEKNQIDLQKFEKNEFKDLLEKSLGDLFSNVEENVELNNVLSKILKKSPKNNSQNFQEKLELSFKNSLKKNLVQRNSIRRFITLLFSDLHSLLQKKDVF